jgi:hypothetical protein
MQDDPDRSAAHDGLHNEGAAARLLACLLANGCALLAVVCVQILLPYCWLASYYVLRGSRIVNLVTAWEHYDKKGYHRCHPPHGYKLRKSELFFFIAKKYNYKKNMGFYKNLL